MPIWQSVNWFLAGALANRLLSCHYPHVPVEETAEKVPTELVQANVTRAVRILMAQRDIRHQEELADLLGVASTTLSRKMNGARKWTVEDVNDLARVLAAPVGDFYTGRPRSRWSLQDVRMPTGQMHLFDGNGPAPARFPVAV